MGNRRRGVKKTQGRSKRAWLIVYWICVLGRIAMYIGGTLWRMGYIIVDRILFSLFRVLWSQYILFYVFCSWKSYFLVLSSQPPPPLPPPPLKDVRFRVLINPTFSIRDIIIMISHHVKSTPGHEKSTSLRQMVYQKVRHDITKHYDVKKYVMTLTSMSWPPKVYMTSRSTSWHQKWRNDNKKYIMTSTRTSQT